VGAPDVLLVDDSVLVTEPLALLLTETGHRVRTALLDLTLPDGDGLQLLHALAAEGRSPRAAVALTGHDDPATAARCRDAGCVAVLVKPVRVAELLRRIREWTAG
jgi:CheY-like chemotaxis protein